MLVDESGMFISQRKFPKMSLINMQMDDNGFVASFSRDKIKSEILIPFTTTKGNIISATVWDDTFDVILCDEVFGNFFSDILGSMLRLVYLPDSSQRYFDIPNESQFGITSLADAYPLLLMGTASLHNLNSKLIDKIGMDRFRPNLIVETTEAFEEDFFGEFIIGQQNFVSVKQCSRCIVTTVDQTNGIIGKEPLKTLAEYRSFKNQIMFGMNVAPLSEFQSVTVGDLLVMINSK